MAQVFTKALSPYELALQELTQRTPAPSPMFSPEERQRRIAGNDAQVGVGLLGQLSGSEDFNNVGAQVFKNALANRQERVTNRGITDPLTGETSIDPEYAAEQDEGRKAKILQAALRFEDQRQRAEERAAQIREAAQMRAALAAGGSEIKNLRADLLRAQIDATKGRTEAAEEKTRAASERVRTHAKSAATRAASMVQALTDAENEVGNLTTGVLGKGLSRVPGTSAYKLARIFDTIKANIGFSELNQMRQESPTGGALGQVAIRELEMLQATLGNLDLGQDKKTLKDNITKVKQHFQNIADSMAPALAEGSPVGPATDIAPQGAAPRAAPTPAVPGASATPQTIRLIRGPDGKLVPAP